MGTYILISIFILITCVILVLVVLVQNAKGGGLAPNFASNNQIMGVRKTTDFLEKTTWTLAIILVVLTLTSTFVIPKQGDMAARASEIQDRLPATNIPPGLALPVETPVEQQPQIPEDLE